MKPPDQAIPPADASTIYDGAAFQSPLKHVQFCNEVVMDLFPTSTENTSTHDTDLSSKTVDISTLLQALKGSHSSDSSSSMTFLSMRDVQGIRSTYGAPLAKEISAIGTSDVCLDCLLHGRSKLLLRQTQGTPWSPIVDVHSMTGATSCVLTDLFVMDCNNAAYLVSQHCIPACGTQASFQSELHNPLFSEVLPPSFWPRSLFPLWPQPP